MRTLVCYFSKNLQRMTMNTQTNVCCTKQNQLVPHIYKKNQDAKNVVWE